MHVSPLGSPSRAQPSPGGTGATAPLGPSAVPPPAILTGAEANECLFPSIKASYPPLIYGAKVFAINTTYEREKKWLPERKDTELGLTLRTQEGQVALWMPG